MTTPPTSPSAPAVSQPAEPVYAESELYDSPADLIRWPLLAPLLRTWQTEVWEKDHTEFRGCWRYDQDANRLQKWHRWAVFLAAIAGTMAVVLAILQLSIPPDDLESVLKPVVEGFFRSLTVLLAHWSMPVFEIICLLVFIMIFG